MLPVMTYYAQSELQYATFDPGFSKVILVQPSSETVEGVFSVLKRHFTQNQHSSLQDLVETSVMLEFNNS